MEQRVLDVRTGPAQEKEAKTSTESIIVEEREKCEQQLQGTARLHKGPQECTKDRKITQGTANN
jgi:hypothetical protein